MKSVKVCEYSRSRSFHYDLILQDQASGERSQDQWSSGYVVLMCKSGLKYRYVGRAVCAYAHNFQKQPGCALIGACALIRMITVMQ